MRDLPEVGAVYETNLNELLVLWCIRIEESNWATHFEFMILEGNNTSGNLIRSWTLPKPTRWSIYGSCDFTIHDAMRKFRFKRIA